MGDITPARFMTAPDGDTTPMAAVPLTPTAPMGATIRRITFFIIGTPLVAFLIAASAMFESRGLPIPLVRIGTGAAGSYCRRSRSCWRAR